MRLASTMDYWRKIEDNKNYGFRLNSLTFENLRGVQDGIIKFSSGITAICGANGMGKSTLLKAIDNCLMSIESEKDLDSSFIKQELSMIAELKVGKEDISRFLFLSSESSSIEPEKIIIKHNLVDASIEAPKLMKLFKDMDNIDELIESEGLYFSNSEEVKLLSYIVGKNYTSCKTLEVDMAGIGLVPYFIVEEGDIKYGSEEMGLGEKAAHYIYWNLRKSSKNTIVLLEEPETYLAPRSQIALLDVIAKLSYKNKFWVILTTHSHGILNNIPAENVRFLTKGIDNVRIIEPKSKKDYLQNLGISSNKTGVIFVEDRASRVFSKYWLGKFCPNLLNEFEIVDISGVENIEKQLTIFPSTINWVKIVGLFDGDQRGKILTNINWPYSFLPGTESLELQFIEITRLMRNELATMINQDLTKIDMALSLLHGKDPHDWLTELPSLLGLSYEQMMGVLFELCYSNEIFNKELISSFDHLVAKILENPLFEDYRIKDYFIRVI